ncbi:MAG: hypothetical protein KJO53_00025, partial [Eudoraea sp.]|nr:hypothetical protein [Eudoraea sp.]
MRVIEFMRYLYIVLLFLLCLPAAAQDKLPPQGKQKDSTQFRKRNPQQAQATDGSESITRIEEYKIISYSRDTTFLDTTLTIQKEYKYNFLRRDDFELMPF